MLQLRNIEKSFNSQTALSRLNLDIQEGDFYSLLGPSGCGKTTLMRIISGLERDFEGTIIWKGKRMEHLPARERPFNMVFQKYALFPHLNIFDNLAFGLRLKKIQEKEIKSRAEETLNLVGLSGYESRLPETLSGGQQQRVALARALINRPEILMLDEPLSALDQKLREHMQAELRLLQRKLGLTFIFVTHDQEEAMVMSDRIAVMNEGHIVQEATPRELYEKPATPFCAQFIGRMNRLEGDFEPASSSLTHKSLGKIQVKSSGQCTGQKCCRAQAFIRPEKIRVHQGQSATNLNVVKGSVEQITFRGHQYEILIQVSDSNWLSFFTPILLPQFEASLNEGSKIEVEFSADDVLLFAIGADSL